MSGPSTLSLTEAVTDLEFGRAETAATILSALSRGFWGCSRSNALTRLTTAVHTLCDAGYNSDVKIWGKRITPSANATPRVGPLQQLTQAECLQFRLFAPGRDALWSGINRGDEYADAFDAEESEDGFDELCVDKADFDKLMAKHRGTSNSAKARPTRAVATINLPSLSDRDLKRWWDSLSDKERDLPMDKLHKQCVAAHPNNSIARQRVRDIAPKRKPGPRAN